eukprot:5059433-Prymnesium_polylepis.1
MMLRRARLGAVVLEQDGHGKLACRCHDAVAARPQRHDGIDFRQRHARAKCHVVAWSFQEELVCAHARPRLVEPPRAHVAHSAVSGASAREHREGLFD